MNTSETEKDSEWQKTPYANLVRYKSSAIYFARFRVRGKLIRRGLKTSQIPSPSCVWLIWRNRGATGLVVRTLSLLVIPYSGGAVAKPTVQCETEILLSQPSPEAAGKAGLGRGRKINSKRN